VAGGWRRLNNEELHNLYTSPNIVGIIGLRRQTKSAINDRGHLQENGNKTKYVIHL
jgi:hypothetical protein